jgi:hypothetical protein
MARCAGPEGDNQTFFDARPSCDLRDALNEAV